MKIHLLMIEDAGGVRLPLAAYDDEFAALDARQSKIGQVDVREALELLGATYVVMSIEYSSEKGRRLRRRLGMMSVKR